MVDIICYWDDNVSNAHLMNANLVTWLSEQTNLPFLNNFQQTSPIASTTAPTTTLTTGPTTAPILIPPLSGEEINT